MEPAIVMNEAEFLEFVHEKIHSRPRGANHFRQCFLRYLGDQCLRLVVLSVASQQKKSASEPFLGRIKELIDYPFVSGTP